LEYPHSHSTPPSKVLKSNFVGQKSSMSTKIKIHTLAPRVQRSYNTRNTPRPNENQKSPTASCSTSVIGNTSREHVDLLGDIEDGGTSKNQPKCNHSICGYM